MAEPVRVREMDDEERRRLLRIIRRGTGSVVTWRRARTVLLSAQGMAVATVAEVSFTSDDRVRDAIRRTPPGSTASRPSSRPCATSPSTAPTMPATRSRAA
jgi:hypothetical protein